MSEPRDDLLRGWRAPSPPAGLERRVLSAARDPQLSPVSRRIEDRIWESRGLRAGWLAAASLLLAANLLVSDRDRPMVTRLRPDPDVIADERIDIGVEIPPYRAKATTLADANRLAIALLDDPCLDPSNEGDCT